MGLAVMLEIPLIIFNIQRGGPSQVFQQRPNNQICCKHIMAETENARCRSSPLPHPRIVLMHYESVRIAVQHMTPVIFLSDGYIANGAEPWKFPKSRFAGNQSEIQKRIG